MTIADIPGLILIIATYTVAAGVAVFVPSFVLLRIYRRKMDRIYRSTGLNPYLVPFPLRSLIPLAAKWGIEDDEERHAFQHTVSVQEKLELSQKIAGKEELIKKWVVSSRIKKPSLEIKAFARMLDCLEEMALFVDPEFPSNDQATELSLNGPSTIVPLERSSTYRRKIRVIKVPGIFGSITMTIFYVFYFFVFGKLWTFFNFHGVFGDGIVLVLVLSGLASVFTCGLIIGTIRLIGFGKIEIKF
jgi:hypothetical protein